MIESNITVKMIGIGGNKITRRILGVVAQILRIELHIVIDECKLCKDKDSIIDAILESHKQEQAINIENEKRIKELEKLLEDATKFEYRFFLR